MTHASRYLNAISEIAAQIDKEAVEDMVETLIQLRKNKGRLFILGVGGSAANCSHAVNDFRKIAKIEAYAPVDNVAELTARTNDEGWNTVFTGFLDISQLSQNDCLLIFSVGGGDAERNVSANLVEAMKMAESRGSKILSIVGRSTGYAAKVSDVCVVIPQIEADLITPISEAWQGVVWHLIVSDPRLMAIENKWESLTKESVNTPHPSVS